MTPRHSLLLRQVRILIGTSWIGCTALAGAATAQRVDAATLLDDDLQTRISP
ncbi:MAG: hypothetical protein HZA66_09685 [Rhodopseudomonas palustris]|uniref:Uncharacterized protein n=1 Tax=Rhodopseudomonas palustris TaxID=1076 RepID=A0A933RW17_RHOPL|nr:hypothetical protein [Rhodopseudomonas palustris]